MTIILNNPYIIHTLSPNLGATVCKICGEDSDDWTLVVNEVWVIRDRGESHKGDKIDLRIEEIVDLRFRVCEEKES